MTKVLKEFETPFIKLQLCLSDTSYTTRLTTFETKKVEVEVFDNLWVAEFRYEELLHQEAL